MKISVKDMILGAMFIAIGVILPQAFHAAGMIGGPKFLPMHIPVLMAGFFISPIAALFVGAITPILSSLITLMPPVGPILANMIFELAAYGFVSSLLYRRFKNVIISLIGAMVAGRIVYGISVFVMANLLNIKLPPNFTVVAAVTTGWIGIVIQLVFIPALVLLIQRGTNHGKSRAW